MNAAPRTCRIAIAAALVSAAAGRVPRVTAQGPSAAQPISIEDAMRAAEESSNLVEAARAESDAAHAEVTVARSGWLPQVSANGSYVRTLASEFDELFDTGSIAGMDGPTGLMDLPFGRTHTWRVGLGASQRLFDFGRTSAGIAAARAAAARATVEVTSRRAQAVLQVTEAYYDALLAQQLVAIAEASLRLAEDTLRLTRLGFAQGTTPEFDALRAEVTRDDQRVTLLDDRARRDLALIRLRRLLGIPLGREIALTSQLTPEPAGLGDVAVAIAGVARVADRAPVAQARLDVAAQRAAADAAAATRWPDLGVFTDFGLIDYPSGGVPDSDWRRNWTAGVTVAWPLFTGFATSGRIAAARARTRAAQAQLEETAELAAVDALQVRTDLEVATATLAVSTRSAALARRAYRIAEVRYQQGVSSYLELADARLSLDRAQSNEARAARDVRVARVRLALLPALPLSDAIAALPPATRAPAAITTIGARAPGLPGPTTEPAGGVPFLVTTGGAPPGGR